jgi:uroporphyrinogen-III synthase
MIYILSEKKIDDAISLPMIKFKYQDISIDIDSYDAIIFTSKNGVKSLDSIDKSAKWKNKQIYSIGSATTNSIKSLGADIIYEARDFYGDEFAKEIANMLKNKRVLYPRAKVVVSNLVDILTEALIDIEDIVTYETYCSDEIYKIPKNSTIIFSSPSTIECFFKHHIWDSSYKAIAIGKKSAQYIPNGIKYYISDIQTLQGCVDYAKKLQR